MTPAGELDDQVHLDRLLPDVVRDWLIEETHAPSSSPPSRQVEGTVVSADISGFTKLAEQLAKQDTRLASERLTDAINRCFEPMIDAILDRDGDILKFGGDALFALFSGANGPDRAAVAAAAMQRVITTIDVGQGARLSMTVGIATGPVSLLLAGTTRRRLIVDGPTVDECLTLEADAEPGEVLVSAATAKALPATWITEPEPEVLALSDQIPLDEAEAPATLLRERARLPEPSSGAVDLSVGLGADMVDAISSYSGTSGELRQAAIAFVLLPTADLGATTVSDVVERLNRLTDRYRASIIGIDVNTGGVKFLLSAGAPVASGNDEEALLSIVTELVLAPDAPPMRAGVNRGLVFAGFLGSWRRRVFTVMGDTVNLAARLLGKADLGSIVASDGVLDRARSGYDTTPLPPVLVRGRVDPVTVFNVGQAIATPRKQRPRPRFVGRDDESRQLRSALESARLGRGAAIGLVGEAGVGTTRIVEELAGAVPQGTLWFDLRGSVATRWRPFATVQPFLRAVAAVPEDGSDEAVTAHLERWVERAAPNVRELLPLVAPAFGATSEPTETSSAIAPELRQDRANTAIVDLLTATVTVPTLIIVDDFHWVDDASRALLESIAAACPDRPWALATSTRADGDPMAESSTTITVGPLGLADTQAIVASSSDLPEPRQREIAIRSGGNPLFAVELTAMAMTSGDLPDSIEAVVTAQIDRLGHEARVVLRSASVLGQEFDAGVLESVVGPGTTAQATELRALIEDEGDGQLRFRSAIVRDVAYAGLSARHRRHLHGQVATAIEQQDGDMAVLAWHHQQAGNREQAWSHYRASATRAGELGLMSDAARHWSAAVEVADQLAEIGDEPDGLTEALVELFHTASAAGQPAVALGAGERALTRIPDRLERAKLLVRVAMVDAETNGSYRLQADRLSTEMADAEGDDVRSWLGSRLAALENRLGNLDTAVAVAEEAEAAARKSDQPGPLASALLVRHSVLAHRADPRRYAMREEVIGAAEAAGDQLGLLRAHNNVGLDFQDSGDWNEAKDHYLRSADYAAERGDTYRQFAPRFNLAVIQADQGRWDDARVALDELRRTAQADDGGSAMALTQRELGRLEVSAGRTAVGREWLDLAHHWFAELGNAAPLQEIELARIAADLADGRSDDALQGIEAFDPDDLPLYLLGRLETMTGYAELQRGRPDEALAAFDEALSATETTNRFGYAVALTGHGEALGFLDRARAARRSATRSAEILNELGVITLPHIPLPK